MLEKSKPSEKFRDLINYDVPRTPLLGSSHCVKLADGLTPDYPVSPHGFIASYCRNPSPRVKSLAKNTADNTIVITYPKNYTRPKRWQITLAVPEHIKFAKPAPQISCMSCPITAGLGAEEIFDNFRFAYAYEGDPIFKPNFTISVHGHAKPYYTHIFGLEYSQGESRDFYDLSGIIRFHYPSQETVGYHLFTATYSVIHCTGRICIYAPPVDLFAFCKPVEKPPK